MDRKQFNKKINKLISEDNLYLVTIQDLIESEKKSIFFKGKIIDYINDDLEFILSECDFKYQVIEYLYSFDKIRKTIDKNIISYLRFCDHFDISHLLSFKELNLMNRINEDFNYFSWNVKFIDLLSLYFFDKTFILTEENKNKLNVKIKDNKQDLAKVFFGDVEENKKDYETVLDIIVKIIDELLETSNLNYSDIKYIGSGSSSKVLLIGDKVLKLGGKRATYKIPNDERLLQPLIRVNLEDYSDVEGTIEVVNQVDAKVSIDKEDLYKLYKELRSRGIIFTDIRPSNLGYLLKANNYHFPKVLSDDANAKGLIGYPSKILKKGELVIIDSDYLFKDDKNPRSILFAKEFENRYNREQNINRQDDIIEENVEIEENHINLK